GNLETDTHTSEIYSLSLHDALPILTADSAMDQVVERAPLPPEARFLARTLRPTMVAEFDGTGRWVVSAGIMGQWRVDDLTWQVEDRKSTRLNSSHDSISYAVFCLKK